MIRIFRGKSLELWGGLNTVGEEKWGEVNFSSRENITRHNSLVDKA